MSGRNDKGPAVSLRKGLRMDYQRVVEASERIVGLPVHRGKDE